jgi:hypothetical protein
MAAATPDSSRIGGRTPLISRRASKLGLPQHLHARVVGHLRVGRLMLFQGLIGLQLHDGRRQLLGQAVVDFVGDQLALVIARPQHVPQRAPFALQRLVGLAAFGHVAEKGQEAGPAVEDDAVPGDVGVEDAPIFSEDGTFFIDRNPALGRRFKTPQVVVHFLRRMDVRDRRLEQLLLAIAEHSTHRGIDADKRLRGDVGNQQALDHPLVDRLQLDEAFAKGLLGRFPFGDVADDRHHGGRVAGGIAKNGR